MVVQRWNPFTEVDRMLHDMDRLFSDATNRTPLQARVMNFHPWVDLYDTGEQLVVKALIPGATANDIDVSLEQNVLTLSGTYGQPPSDDGAKKVTWYRREIGYGKFAESITLPVPIDAEHAEASFSDGVLTLYLPKAEQARTKHIPVRSTQALTGSLN